MGEQTIDEVAAGEEAMGEEAMGEQAMGEDLMVDALEQLAPKEGAMNSTTKGDTLRFAQGVEEALATQVPSIDTLLGDIYELKYQLVQANPQMYRYMIERDRYHQERDEACTFLQGAQEHQLGSTSTFKGSGSSTFIHGICQQQDYYSGIVQTWLIGVPAFAPRVQYPMPPSSYMPINISAYQVGNSAQGIMGSPGRTTSSGASPNKSATPQASSLGVVGSSELQGAQCPASPIGSIGTTPPGQGTKGFSRQ